MLGWGVRAGQAKIQTRSQKYLVVVGLSVMHTSPLPEPLSPRTSPCWQPSLLHFFPREQRI